MANQFQRDLDEILESNSSSYPDRASKKTVGRLIKVCYRMAGYIDILEADIEGIKSRLRSAGGEG